MWEEVALEYNSRKSRSWLERDFDSLRRKFRNLYGKPKPTGNNDGLPPKLRPIALAHEVQHAIEMKAGAHTSHDGFDRGQDDAYLLRDVADVLNEDVGGVEDQVSALNEDEPDMSDPLSDGEREDEEDSQVEVVDFRKRAGGEVDADGSSTVAPIVTGAVVTRRGTFDASLADEVWSEDDGEDEVRQRDDTTLTSPEDGSADGSAAASGDAGPPCTADSEDGDLTQQQATSTPPSTSGSKTKAVGRPRGGGKSPATAARATYASPGGAPLARDPSRALDDAIEMARNKKKSTASNRLGGCDLRVMRDNLDELTTRPPSASGKRDAPESSSSGATYASNKRVGAKTRLEELRKEMDEATDKQSAAGADMLQVLVFMREDADRRAETEDRRRREDREAAAAAEKRERRERDALRREEAVAAEARRYQEAEANRLLREEQGRKEAELATESRRRYEERTERDRAEARERHDQMMLLIATMQRGGPQVL
ncbi:hypothetical protein PF010_g10055 [Phytophthora fragariae]|nr:hypothetical protein PF011_g11023 [Phytophthora fragariae]KAE9113517.1 hypothetical protein PF010_g10055 [Phytophthora fragariae]